MMRNLTTASSLYLLTCLLSTLSISAKQSHHHEQATVYMLAATQSVDSAVTTASTSTVTPADANAVISAFLDIAEHEYLRDGLDIPEQVVYAASRPHLRLENTQPLLIVADKLSKDGGIADYASPDKLATTPVLHTLTVDRSPSQKSWLGLVKLYAERLTSKFGYAAIDEQANDKAKRFLLGSFNGDYALGANMQDEAFEPFLQSMAQAASAQENNGGSVHLTGIPQLAFRFGKDSTEVQQAKEMLRLTVDSLLQSHEGKTVFVVSSYPHTLDGRQIRASTGVEAFSTLPMSLRKRQTSPGVMPLVGTSEMCFLDQASCQKNTSSCSGHGTCVRGRRVGPASSAEQECWTCQCSVTKDKTGRNRYYGGSACQKEDISSQFFLLVGSTLLLVLVVIAAIALLAGVGSEPLPSTLAAMGGAASGHHKRD